MWAAARNNAPAIRLLVEAGADIARAHQQSDQERSQRGDRGLHQPASHRLHRVPLRGPRRQHRQRARPARCGSERQRPAVRRRKRARRGDRQRALGDGRTSCSTEGADPNLAGAGWNALHQTVHSRRPNLGYTPGPVPTGSLDSINVVKKLIARGVKLDARMSRNGMKDGQRNRVNRLGATAFFLAAKNNDLEVMKVLADAGADARIPSADGTTPLMVAAGLAMWYVGEDGGSLPGQEDEVLEAVKLCVALGNDVNAANAAGETPMHGAAFRGVNPVVDFLVAQGAKLDPRDVRGWTPFTVASGIAYGDVYKQQPQTAELLKKLLTERGLSTEGQIADGTECLDCIQTHADQARAALERDRKMEAEFAKMQAEQAAPTAASAIK